MNETSAFQEQQPAYVQKSGNRKNLLIIFFVILILVVAGLVGLYILGGSSKHPATQSKVIPTIPPAASPTTAPEASKSATITVTATPSAAAKIDKTTLQVSVQNGSGTVGAAQKMASTLQNAGYTKVTTGNADAYTYQGITIHVKKKFSDYLPVLEKDISAGYPNEKVKTAVDDTIATDAVVIIGK